MFHSHYLLVVMNMCFGKKGALSTCESAPFMMIVLYFRNGLLLCYGSSFGFWIKLDEVGTCTNLDIVATIGKTCQGTTKILFP